jgi:hypothetical protein
MAEISEAHFDRVDVAIGITLRVMANDLNLVLALLSIASPCDMLIS